MDNLNRDLVMVLRNVLTQLPSFFTLLVCLVIAVARWKRHPKVSLVTALGLIFLILHALFFSAAYIWIPRILAVGSFDDNPKFFNRLALFTSFLFAAAFGTLLTAIFIDRQPKLG